MKFLLDQGIPKSAALELSNLGHDAVHVSDIGMASATDQRILEEARRQDAAVVTLDADFHTILAVLGLTQASVIRIRIEGLKGARIAEIVHEVVVKCETDLKLGSAVTVNRTRIRIRRLPLV